MKNQKYDDFTREEEIHQRDLEDSDQYSSSESCSNNAIPILKNTLDMKDEDLMLDDAISYLKRLQDRVNTLEEQNKTIYVVKTWGLGDNNFGESNSSSVYQFKKNLPEIEVKAQGKDVLIRVHCENKKGYHKKVIEELEKLHLNVENISSLPFGDYFLDITVSAQMDDEYCMTVKDLKRELKAALQPIM